LTTEFLDYASTRPPKLVEASVDDIVGYVADASCAHASKKGVHFEISERDGIRARVDECRLQEALMNLLLNAVDASPIDGKVALRVYERNQWIHIDVENSGPAITEPALSRLFEPFFTTKPRGTGLGLAIARNIMHAQGGDLVLAVNETDRVCFSLILLSRPN